jgi:hypothetical protein
LILAKYSIAFYTPVIQEVLSTKLILFVLVDFVVFHAKISHRNVVILISALDFASKSISQLAKTPWLQIPSDSCNLYNSSENGDFFIHSYQPNFDIFVTKITQN